MDTKGWVTGGGVRVASHAFQAGGCGMPRGIRSRHTTFGDSLCTVKRKNHTEDAEEQREDVEKTLLFSASSRFVSASSA